MPHTHTHPLFAPLYVFPLDSFRCSARIEIAFVYATPNIENLSVTVLPYHVESPFSAEVIKSICKYNIKQGSNSSRCTFAFFADWFFRRFKQTSVTAIIQIGSFLVLLFFFLNSTLQCDLTHTDRTRHFYINVYVFIVVYNRSYFLRVKPHT